jgi:hypothetical protein
MIINLRCGLAGLLVAGAHVLQGALRASPFVGRFWSMELPLIATLWTIDKERPSGTNNSQVTVAEMSKTQPVALVNWFYPDRLTGHEFVYSEQMERRLVENNQITVTAQPAI